MSEFSFTAPAVTKRDERKAKCGGWFTRVNAYFGDFTNLQINCGLYQGLDHCPKCRQDVVLRETANASEAGSWLYWVEYLPRVDSAEWRAACMWMRRHGIRYRWCYQGDDGIRFLLTENSHPSIPGLQQIKVEDINWNAIMDEMPEGSSFRGPLRVQQLSKEDKGGHVLIWQRQVQVKAMPGVQAEAQHLALGKTFDLDPKGKTACELGAMMAKRMEIFEEELVRLGGKVVTSRMAKIRVNLDLIDWTSYRSRPTSAKERDPTLVTAGYAVMA